MTNENIPMNTTRREVLNIYRTILRRSQTYPMEKIRRKICFNIRDAIEFYKPITDPIKIKELIKYGQLFDKILRNIASLPTEHLKFLTDSSYGPELFNKGITDLREWENNIDK
ncbi:hypothetical protein LOD99_5867 [Oopsacas minuta]|uniref:Complex 1 LYR protein domain-containing protein n=1 Tax=Oopsacas minuta TaxID=111878 RepID=A0AAV7JND7_9METZ|nr:hypothetical protein LOD99_5867 [Oopsacas minuta]